jgi:hypothetical protein
MNSGNWGALARIVALLFLAVAIWALSKYYYAKPQVLGETAPAAEFSAGRAYATLGRLLGPEKPHPVSTQENAAVRARIQAEFAKLGVKTSTYSAFACNAWRGFNYIPCATVTDILAEVVPGQGKAIVLLAHYDSVPAGPGASDDESGVSIVLETARALRARGGNGLHPVLAVITDGEEAGLLGAQAFLENPALKARVGAVINVEARGTRGRSLLFQTSPGDSALIDLYAKSVPFYSTSSLFAEIYRALPNDTDLTLFIRQGFPSFNFAFSDNVADYHTPLDRRENLSRLTLQEQGSNMLGVAAELEQTAYADLAGHKEVYLDLFGYVVPRMPASWAVPLSLVVLLIFVAGAWRTQGFGARQWLTAMLMPPSLLAVCVLTGWALHFIAQLISGQPDPSYAYPIALREGLAFGVVAAVVFAARMAEPRLALLAAWIWFAALSLLTAIFLPGISPYFLFPALAAAAAAIVSMFVPARFADWVFAAPVLVALSVWIALVAAGEGLLGLKLHPLFTVPAAFAAMTLTPLLDARAMRKGVWILCISVSLGAALIATLIAGFQPAFSRTMAQRLSIRYVEDGTTKKSKWSLDAGAPLPPPLRKAADFAADPHPIFPGPFPNTYDAPVAGPPRFATPPSKLMSDAAGPNGRRLTVMLYGPDADVMVLWIPKDAGLRHIDLRDEHLDAPADFHGDVLLLCESRDCAETEVTLDVASPAKISLFLAQQRFGLPPFAAKLVAARPKTAIPSQSGDVTILVSAIDVPGR